MKRSRLAVFTAMILALVGIAVFMSSRAREHDARDLRYWIGAGAGQDWRAAAAAGNPRGQFHLGAELVRTNLQIMVDRVPLLSAVPYAGKRLFTETSYGFDRHLAPEQAKEAQRWIKQSADQGFTPAKELEKLLDARVGAAKE